MKDTSPTAVPVIANGTLASPNKPKYSPRNAYIPTLAPAMVNNIQRYISPCSMPDAMVMLPIMSMIKLAIIAYDALKYAFAI